MFAFLKKLFGRADVNQDGKVDAKDAKVVAEKVGAKVEAAATKIKAEAKAGAAKVKIARAKKSKSPVKS